LDYARAAIPLPRYTAQVSQVEPVGAASRSPVTVKTPGGDMEQHQSAIDPVCAMSVDPERAGYRSFQKGGTYHFCSARCKETFDKNPGKYIRDPKGTSGG
jgi:YHS domain-containing protein